MLRRFNNRWRKSPLSIDERVYALAQWYRSPLGQCVAEAEQAAIDELLTNVFGYHLLELSACARSGLAAKCRVAHQFALFDVPEHGIAACAQGHQLPLANASVDVVVLHHTLEFNDKPHQTLREAERVLIAGGYLLVVGFSRFSLLGLRFWLQGLLAHKRLWRQANFGRGRLFDWLQLLGLQTQAVRDCFYRLPTQHPAALARPSWLESVARRFKLPVGGAYVLLARKESLAMTPLKPRWTPVNLWSPLGAVERSQYWPLPPKQGHNSRPNVPPKPCLRKEKS